MSLTRSVAITGMGAVSAQGWSVDALWHGITQGRSGLGKLSLFTSPKNDHLPVAQVPPCDEQDNTAHVTRSIHLAEHATRQAMEQAGLLKDASHDPRRIGLILGACTGGMLETEAYMTRLLEHGEGRFDLASHHVPAVISNHLAQVFNINGPIATVSDACASGASAVAMACDWINAGWCDRVVCGGVDVLTRLTLNGFASLLVVAQDGCKPFDANRQGMSLGEGAGILVLENTKSAQRRDAALCGFVTGWATTCDAYHPSGPEPEGNGALAAMQYALECAKCDIGNVDYVNPHGSGTHDNDRAEAMAMRKLFGDVIPPFSSTKRYMGHTLAAAGALEAIICLLAMRHGKTPANLGFEDADPELGISPVTTLHHQPIRTAMSNSLGFGGVNASLVLTCDGGT